MIHVISTIRGDIRNILRDRMLVIMPFVPFLAATALRFIFPFACHLLAPVFDLAIYAPYLGAFFLLMSPVMMGFIGGFLFLDENEAGILTSIAVSPIGLTRFSALRFGTMMILSILTTLAAWPLLGVPARSFSVLFLSAFFAAMCAPFISLFILSFAKNKVEGLAIAKLSGFVLLAPIASAVAPKPWDRLAGILPTWWVSAAFLGPNRDGLSIEIAAIGVILLTTVWTLGFGTLARKRILEE